MEDVTLVLRFHHLPQAAQDLISPEQRSYIDEFTFLLVGDTIQAWYGGELLACWNGKGWQLPTHSPMTGDNHDQA
jgi:hypothetical protein